MVLVTGDQIYNYTEHYSYLEGINQKTPTRTITLETQCSADTQSLVQYILRRLGDTKSLSLCAFNVPRKIKATVLIWATIQFLERILIVVSAGEF